MIATLYYLTATYRGASYGELGLPLLPGRRCSSERGSPGGIQWQIHLNLTEDRADLCSTSRRPWRPGRLARCRSSAKLRILGEAIARAPV